MTDKELIEAQEQDIRNLINTIRIRDDQIEVMKNSANNYGTDFKFDTPYFRVEKYYITCYRLVNIVFHKWQKSMKSPAIDLRFSRCFTLNLNDEKIYNNPGGNQVLRTCITWDELKNKLLRRMKIATNKNDTKSVAHWNTVLLMLKEKVNECDALFNEEVK